MLVPSINSKGVFELKEPFNSLIDNNAILTVTQIRTLQEFVDNEESPLELIYKASGIEEKEYISDIVKGVPIVTFLSSVGKRLYVPARYIKSITLEKGVEYKSTNISIDLGYLPVDFSTELLEDIIKQNVYDTLSIVPIVKKVTGNTINVDDVEDKQYKALMKSKRTIDKSYKTRLEEALNRNSELENIVKLMTAKIVKLGE